MTRTSKNNKDVIFKRMMRNKPLRLIISLLLMVIIPVILLCGCSKSRTAATTPIPPQVASWQGGTLHRVNLTVKESGDFHESELITRSVQTLLAGLGIELVQSPPYDGTITIVQTGNIFDVPYKEEKYGWHTTFQGAETNIEITLSGSGSETIKGEGNSKIFPAVRISSDSSGSVKPEEVIIPALIDAMTDIWSDYLLITALVDPDEEIRSEAVQHLKFYYDQNKTMTPAPGAVSALVKVWQQSTPFWKEGSGDTTSAYDALLALGDRASELIPTLVEFIVKDDKPKVNGFTGRQTDAGKLLVSIGPKAVPTIIQLLEHPSANIRVYSADALGKIEPTAPEVIPALTKALRDKNTLTAEYAAKSLLKKKPEIVLPTLTEILKDQNENTDVRMETAHLLATLWKDQPDLVLTTLLDILNDNHENESVRKSIIWSLAYLVPNAHDTVLPILIKILDSEGLNFRYSAANSLATVGPPAKEAVPLLINAMRKDRNAGGKTIFASSLKAITGQDFGNDVDKWQKWWEQQ